MPAGDLGQKLAGICVCVCFFYTSVSVSNGEMHYFLCRNLIVYS